MTDTRQPTKRPAKKGSELWSDVERAAMQESVRERKRSTRLSPEEERAAGEADINAKIAEMSEPEQAIARRLHALVLRTAPTFVPRTWYGMPAYAKDGKTICFFQPASKFKVRYSTFGFQPDAMIDDGTLWPVAFAVTTLSAADEARIAALVKKAAG